ncbi:15437_t:CDS:2, partial [Acaulospora colombiana]
LQGARLPLSSFLPGLFKALQLLAISWADNGGQVLINEPAGGNFTVEIATNRAFTHYSYGGRLVTAWGDGKNHPDDYSITNLGDEPNSSNSGLHTQNETMAAGTVFAISYESDIKRVTPENLVVFTVAYHTCCPSCLSGGRLSLCMGPNMYMMPHKCKVTGATSTTPLAPAVPPQWCEDDEARCVQGPKQMIFWNQLDGNNVVTTGTQKDGAQDDIFLPPSSSSTIATSTPGELTTSTAISGADPSTPSLCVEPFDHLSHHDLGHSCHLWCPRFIQSKRKRDTPNNTLVSDCYVTLLHTFIMLVLDM